MGFFFKFNIYKLIRLVNFIFDLYCCLISNVFVKLLIIYCKFLVELFCKNLIVEIGLDLKVVVGFLFLKLFDFGFYIC